MQTKAVRLKLFMSKLWAITKKLKYGVALVVVVLIGVIIWQYHETNINNNWKKATDDYQRADYTDAAKILNNMPIPNDTNRLAIYAQTMLATRQLSKAATAYQKLYNAKKDPFSELVLGNIYNQQKNYPAATKIYTSLIQANPTYTQTYVNLGTLYKLQGNNTQAIATAEEGVKNNPNNIVLNELLVSFTMTDKSSPAYTAAVQKLKQLNPNDPLLALLQ